MNVSEWPDHYTIEMAAAGCSREDFFIEVNSRTLSISAIIKKSDLRNEEHQRLHAADYACLKHDIELPADVDPDFAAASCQDGILRINLFKAAYPVVVRTGHIVVY